jgi:predicted pyridoxine 5'-phosphate oxidase superfamily flavin-nucleotide-binding protein
VFHEGEIRVQQRAGLREAADRIGRGIRPVLPPRGAAFLAERRFAVLGAADPEGRMWASLVAGPAGFLTAPRPDRVDVRALPAPGDALAAGPPPGGAAALLAIDFAARERVRVNGRAAALDGGFALEVDEAFANCPKYIARRVLAGDDFAPPASVERGGALDAAAARLIAAADTFFIATTHASAGADVSHRGGRPGFVRTDGALRPTWPDYQGNALFQTLGNLATDARAGLLFVDWETGSTLQLTGTARTVWDDGGARAVLFATTEWVRVPHATRLRFGPPEPSPHSP